MEQGDYFKEYFDSVFKHSNLFSQEEYERHCRAFETNYGRFLPQDRKSKILDIGCGAGHFLHFLNAQGYSNFLGIDISEQQIDFCRKNISQNVQCIDATAFLKDKENRYDVITLNDVLEHIPKEGMIDFLILIRQALNQNGVLLIKTPNAGNPFALFSRYRDFTHTVAFAETSLYQVLWLGGFRRIEILSFREKNLIVRTRFKIIHLFISKLFWYQGFVAPRILTHLLLGAARK